MERPVIGFPVASPTSQELARTLGRHANLTFGGGSATIAVLQTQIVERRNCVPQSSFNLAYALSRRRELLPSLVDWILLGLGVERAFDVLGLAKAVSLTLERKVSDGQPLLTKHLDHAFGLVGEHDPIVEPRPQIP